MNDSNRKPLPDLSHFDENRAKYPPEDLVQYAGKCVAWSNDGTRILASADDYLALAAVLKAAGLDPQNTVFSYCPAHDDDGHL